MPSTTTITDVHTIGVNVPDQDEAEHNAMHHRGVNVDDLLRSDGVPPMYTFQDPYGNEFVVIEESR